MSRDEKILFLLYGIFFFVLCIPGDGSSYLI